ncbi:hypothetical protein VTO42DRAFT_371 [Malbranchea cinnamomea]
MAKHPLSPDPHPDSSQPPQKKKKKKQLQLQASSTDTKQYETKAGDLVDVDRFDSSKNSGYVQSKELSALPQSKIDEFLTSESIHVADPCGNVLWRPILSFDHLPPAPNDLYAPLRNYLKPTPIQSATWPLLFAGRDVIGVAETGSGKTLAFGLPCVRRVLELKKTSSCSQVFGAIITPTRELAVQIYDQLIKFTPFTGISVACIYGGASKDDQRRALKKASIVVATPGRLKDFLNDQSVDLKKVKYLVLDEADRMLDKGFEQDIRDIITATASAKRRQTVMFTATWPVTVRNFAASFTTKPVTVTIGDESSTELRANTRIKQVVEVLKPCDKEARLLTLLRQYQSGKSNNDKILVFCLYKKEAIRIERLIRKNGFKVVGIHGDMNQAERFKSLNAFKSGSVSLLVATDVAARGLDIPSVKMVLNVTFPLTVEDYVHRIGRTGRAGADGLAITLFTENDKAQSGALINVLRAAKQDVPEALLKFGTTVKRKQHDAYGAYFKDVDHSKAATKIRFDD